LKELIYKGFNTTGTENWKNRVESAWVTETGMSKVNKIQDNCQSLSPFN